MEVSKLSDWESIRGIGILTTDLGTVEHLGPLKMN